MTAAWLDYAVDVVLGDDHTAECLAHGGGCLEPDGDPHLRWPGYLGRHHRPGGLLLVGNVHRNFSSDGVPHSVSELLVATTRRLRADPVGHAEQYLEDTRVAYLRGLEGDGRSAWNVARPFGYLLREVGLTWHDVAYTNASKSQLVPGADLGPLVRGCLDRWPLHELAKAIDASLVITCSAQARDSLVAAGVPVMHFPQRFSYARLGEIAAAYRANESG